MSGNVCLPSVPSTPDGRHGLLWLQPTLLIGRRLIGRIWSASPSCAHTLTRLSPRQKLLLRVHNLQYRLQPLHQSVHDVHTLHHRCCHPISNRKMLPARMQLTRLQNNTWLVGVRSQCLNPPGKGGGGGFRPPLMFFGDIKQANRLIFTIFSVPDQKWTAPLLKKEIDNRFVTFFN